MENTITCVYCGFNYPENTPTHGAAVLTEHIKMCEKHPMRKLQEENDKMRAVLMDLVENPTKEELIAMKEIFVCLPTDNPNVMVGLKVVNVLLEIL